MFMIDDIILQNHAECKACSRGAGAQNGIAGRKLLNFSQIFKKMIESIAKSVYNN